MAPSPTIRRLLKETAELSASSANPNPTFYAAPVSDSNLHEWHFTLLGPPSPSPYAGGLYHGRITLPTTYPLKPPNFRFLTPSGRFEVNREICLSISGFHEETWMPAWGVRTALTALRSFMAEKGSAGQVGGMEAKAEIREKLARDSRSWKCEGCGGRTNEEVMREWWEVCKERGVKVEEEMSLEELPEGLSLEAREPKTLSSENEIPRKQVQAGHAQAVPTAAPVPVLQDGRGVSDTASSAQPQSSNARTIQCAADPPRLPLQPEDSQSGPSSSAPRPPPTMTSITNSPNPYPSSSFTASTSSTTTAPEPTASTTITTTRTAPNNHSANTDREDRLATGSLDRAIGAIFVLLCAMILKKIFFPASGAGGGGMDNSVYLSGD